MEILLVIAIVFFIIGTLLFWISSILSYIRPKSKGRFHYRFGLPERKQTNGGNVMVEIGVTNEEKVLVTVSPTTHAGKPAVLDGPVTVAVQSGDGTATQVDDKSFYLNSGENPGDTVFVVSADADIGAGVELISEVIVLHVAGAKAANLGITFGVPELK